MNHQRKKEKTRKIREQSCIKFTTSIHGKRVSVITTAKISVLLNTYQHLGGRLCDIPNQKKETMINVISNDKTVLRTVNAEMNIDNVSLTIELMNDRLDIPTNTVTV